MPAIRDLDGTRRSLARTVRVGAGTVARDYLDAGVAAQPLGQALGQAIGQQIDDLVPLQIDEDRSVAAAASPRPVVDCEHARRGRRLGRSLGYAHGHAQQRVGAGGHGEPLSQFCSGFAAECEAEVALQVAQPLGPACGGGSGAGQALGKGPSRASRVQAAKPARPHMKPYRPALPGQVAERALVAAVNPA